MTGRKSWKPTIAFALLFVVPQGAEAELSLNVGGVGRVVRSQGLTEVVGEIIFTVAADGDVAADASIIIQIEPSIHITNNKRAFPIRVTGDITESVDDDLVFGDRLSFTIEAGTELEAGDEFRLQGIRVNVTESGVSFPPGITAEITSASTEVILNNRRVTIAIPSPALSTSGTAPTAIVPAARPLLGCGTDQTPPGTGSVSVGSPGDLPSGSVAFHVVATENFSTAFTTAFGFVSGDERTATNATEVTNATRLLIRVTNLSAGITLFAPGRVDSTLSGFPNTSSSLRLLLVQGADARGAGGSAVTGSADATTVFARFTPTAGAVTIVYEVTLASPNVQETANIPIAVTHTANPSLGQATASVALGPISSAGLSTTTDPIPRFADEPIAGPAFRVIACASHLLFPWVTNQLGYDTGIAISNTSRDPYGTSPQSGTITLHFFGANAPSGSITTPAVAGGGTYTAVLSTIAPGFQGYIIAVANFQFAQGFAFITNGADQLAGPTIAHGYVATVIPDPAVAGSRVE